VLTLYSEGFLIMVGILILLGWALYLPLRGGLMNNAPIFCMAISGYFAAYASKDLSWPVPAASLAAVALSLIISYILSFSLSNVSGFAMSVATIALIFIIQTVIRNLEFLGGAAGYGYFPQLPHLLAITYGCVIVTMILLHRLSNSRVGRAIEAIDNNPETAIALGIDTKSMSIFLQCVSGTIGGLSGVLFAFNTGTLFPEIFSFNFLLYGFTIVIVGGRLTMWGVLLFAPILWGIPEFAPSAIGQWRNVMFGAIIIAILVFRPEGVITKDLLRKLILPSLPRKKHCQLTKNTEEVHQ
jgi:branched-chain amino acid transport system permease protein